MATFWAILAKKKIDAHSGKHLTEFIEIARLGIVSIAQVRLTAALAANGELRSGAFGDLRQELIEELHSLELALGIPVRDGAAIDLAEVFEGRDEFLFLTKKAEERLERRIDTPGFTEYALGFFLDQHELQRFLKYQHLAPGAAGTLLSERPELLWVRGRAKIAF